MASMKMAVSRDVLARNLLIDVSEELAGCVNRMASLKRRSLSVVLHGAISHKTTIFNMRVAREKRDK
jgi:predicted transcriptional regulator